MDKIMNIDGKGVGFRASALTPRLYRHRFGRDIVRDLNTLMRNYKKALAGVPDVVYPAQATEAQRTAIDQTHAQAIQDAQLGVMDLEVFENTAYIMARQYDPTIPDDPDAWLDGFAVFSVYDVLPAIMELWSAQQQTTSRPKN